MNERSKPRPLVKRWASADAALRRRLIVDAALGLLHQRGLAAVTMRNVAGGLGVGTMTLYTYFDGQSALHSEMVARGFEMLHGSCAASGGPAPGERIWMGGARAYVRFAVDNPELYKLMFDHPMSDGDSETLEGGLRPLLDRVTQRLIEQGWSDAAQLPAEARRRAGRFWIALHGIATLAIAGRLGVLGGSLEDLIQDVVARVAPTP